MGLFSRKEKKDLTTTASGFVPRMHQPTPKEESEEKARYVREQAESEMRWQREIASAKDAILELTTEGKEYRGVALTAGNPVRHAAPEALALLVAEGVFTIRLSRKRRPMYQRVR